MGSLIAVGVGSPHDFISNGRRARDIAFGSHLLADLTRFVAHALRTHPVLAAQLIVPTIEAKLPDKDVPARNSNKILAYTSATMAEVGIADIAQKAIDQRWSDWVDRTFAVVAPLVDARLWHAQTAHCEVDLYLATTPCTEAEFSGGGAAVRDARQRAELALAAHKTQRRFAPNPAPAMVPKSSLDGVRESCLVRGGSSDEVRQLRETILAERRPLAYRLRLRASEELDAVGLMKRAASDTVVASVTRVAIDPWVQKVSEDPQGEEWLDRIDVVSRTGSGIAPGEDIAAGSGRHPGLGAYALDGAVLLPDRIAALQTRGSDNELGLRGEVLSALVPLVQSLHDRFGPPQSYYAVMSVDGDGIGEYFAACESFAAQQAVSSALHSHVDDVVMMIRADGGEVLYGGGEDLLALVPITSAFPLLDKISERFAQALPGRTVSAGIAIAHCLDAFDGALNAARAAEAEAKRYRRSSDRFANAGCVCVHWIPRQGAEFRITNTSSRFSHWMDLLVAMHRNDVLADAIGYQLLRISDRYDTERSGDEKGLLREAARVGVRRELDRLVDRRKAEATQQRILREIYEQLDGEHDNPAHCIRVLGQMLVLARRIAVAVPSVRRIAEVA